MIYKPNKKVKTSRTGRQYENTCSNCIHLNKEKKKLENVSGKDNYKYVCVLFPSMDNYVRCIEFKPKEIKV
jgi:hypothetical protein